MGRAPNPGAPQRVSAHVVPKAPAFPAPAPPDALAVPVAYEEDEKTTIESGGWDEEVSTTVEQGEVADKLRALGLDQTRRPNTGITSTNGDSVTDEPTVDDQRGAAALAMLPPPKIARLVITQGNDLGQAIEVRPGKTYTIGRGIDNDLVLTDMTVSRKHFDLRNDDGAWVLADRGSGNGTLINSHLEDAPFVLATGDVIEIGNTTFRFEQPNGIPREPPSYDGGADEDIEPSTMSATPMAEPPEAATPDRLVTPVSRPKTLPPPAPRTRPRPPSNRPGSGYGLERPGQSSRPMTIPPIAIAVATAPTIGPAQLPGLPLPLPGTTLPLPQMANRPSMQPSALLEPPLKSMATTMPGQGPTMQAAHPARFPFAYSPGLGGPRQSGELPRQRQSAILPGVAVVPSTPGREAPSTALVQPIAYTNGHSAMVARQPYTPPQARTRRMKIALAAAAVALFAAIATIAIVRGSSGDATPPGATAKPPDRNGATGPAVESGRDAKVTRSAEPPGNIKAAASRTPQPTATTAAGPPAGKPDKITPIVTPIVTAPASGSATTAAAPVPVPSPPAATRSAQLPPSSPATTSTSSATTAAAPPARPAAADKSSSSPQPSIAVAPKITGSSAAPQPDRVAAAAPERKPPRRSDRSDRSDRNEKKLEKRSPPKDDRADKIEIESQPPRKHSGRTLQDIKSDAGVLYRRKDFSGAAGIASAGAASMTGIDAQELKTMAAIYLQLGKTYSIGMAPGTKPTDAFVALNRAVNFDREVGGAYVAEMQEKLVVVASRAAMLYMAAKDYEAAFQAVKASDSLGSTSPSNKTVRDKLDTVAGDLYRSAQSELSSDRESAKQKLRQILNMVEPKNPLHAKASKLLNGP
jgi:hypothetical protein